MVRQLVAAGRINWLDWSLYLVLISDGQIVLSQVIEIVHAGHLYFGRTYLDSLLRHIAPFLASDLPQPQHWYAMIRDFRDRDTREDFSILAEAYMNFGRYGFVVFLFVGMLVRYISHKVYTTRSPVMLLWSAWMIAVLIVATRADSYTLFSQAILYIVPLLALRGLLAFLNTSTRRYGEGMTTRNDFRGGAGPP